MFTDIEGRPLQVGDTVIFARPTGYKSAAACLDYGTVLRFTKTGVTMRVGSKSMNTPWREDKFYIMGLPT